MKCWSRRGAAFDGSGFRSLEARIVPPWGADPGGRDLERAALLGRDAYRHWAQVPTRLNDNDAYGHVNNTVYYQWFDTVVNQWLIEQGLLDIGRGDLIGLVVETGCRYARSIAFPEAVDIGLAVSRIGTSSVTYRLGVFAQGSDAIAAQGNFTHVYVGRDSRQPVPLPGIWRDVLATLQQ